MEKLITHHVIQTYLTRLNELLILSNSSGESTLTKVCEGLICEMFSIIYDAKFENTNLKISNFPAIDLHQKEQGIAIQVTSNKSLAKVYDCYDKFLKNRLNETYSRLIVVVLSTNDYNVGIIKKKYDAIENKYGVKFKIDFNNDILNLTDIYKLIVSNLNIDELNKIRILLENSFEKVKQLGELDDYYSKLKAMFFDIVMEDEAGLTLNSIYVEPSFDIINEIANKNSNQIKYFDSNSYQLSNDVSIHSFLNSRFRAENTYDEFFQYPKSNVTFVLGYPGQGKTSLCSKLLFDLLTSPQKKPIFYLKLRNVSDTKAFIHSPFNLIFNELDTEIESELKKNQLKNSITILDGLDELFMKDNLSADDIETFCKGIIHETEKHKNWQILITTRHGYIDFERLYKEEYIAISLKPIDLKRQKEWLSRFLEFHPESWLSYDYLDSKDSKNETRNFIGELINQPLLLYIVASLKSAPDKDVNRGEIYNLLFDQIIERKYSKDGQIESLKALTVDDLRRMVQEIALMIFKSGKGFVNTKDILKNEVIKECLENIGENRLSKTLKGIMISFYFKERREKLGEDANEGIEFFHKSLQEYLTAEVIVADTFKYFLNKDQFGKFIIKKEYDALVFLNEYYGALHIPFEIWFFMEDLIVKHDKQSGLLLLERLLFHINYFFKKDFISKIDSLQVNPIEFGFNTFVCYWRIIQLLNSGKNYLHDRSIGQKFLTFYQLDDSLSKNNFLPIDVSHQYFFDQRIPAMHLFEQHWLRTHFIDCYIMGLKFYDCFLERVLFERGDIEISFFGTFLHDVKFFGCDIFSLEISADSIKKLVFENCTISLIENIDSKNKGGIVLKNCELSNSALEVIQQYSGKTKIQNCYIRDYSKKDKISGLGYTDIPIL